MRLTDYCHVSACALCYGTAVVLARFAFEDGSNAATVVSVRCAFAALAIGGALVIAGVIGAQMNRRPATAAT